MCLFFMLITCAHYVTWPHSLGCKLISSSSKQWIILRSSYFFVSDHIIHIPMWQTEWRIWWMKVLPPSLKWPSDCDSVFPLAAPLLCSLLAVKSFPDHSLHLTLSAQYSLVVILPSIATLSVFIFGNWQSAISKSESAATQMYYQLHRA